MDAKTFLFVVMPLIVIAWIALAITFICFCIDIENDKQKKDK